MFRQASQHFVGIGPGAFREECPSRCMVGDVTTTWFARKPRQGACSPERSDVPDNRRLRREGGSVVRLCLLWLHPVLLFLLFLLQFLHQTDALVRQRDGGGGVV